MPETADFVRLAAHVRERRHEMGLTQVALAAEAGATDRLIRSIELGEERNRHPGTLRAVAAALGWTAESIERILAGGDPVELESGPAPSDHDERLDRLERELAALRAELGLPPRARNGNETRSA